VLRDLVLCLPDGREIVCADRLTIEAGTTTLVSGPSGSGKSTLFRAISGIWPYGRGTIDRPADATVMLLPQRPYVPSGTLKTAVAYPSVVGAYSDNVREALELARLAPLACEIDSEYNWPQRLSGGEQQRLAIARAILDKPDWLFLDEATSALDEKLEAEIYRMLSEVLPNTTIVSIGHRSTAHRNGAGPGWCIRADAGDGGEIPGKHAAMNFRSPSAVTVGARALQRGADLGRPGL
jgi:vitamin B12/bleomycin/antimicrobial peptide transport system ATP-binding/permease protein